MKLQDIVLFNSYLAKNYKSLWKVHFKIAFLKHFTSISFSLTPVWCLFLLPAFNCNTTQWWTSDGHTGPKISCSKGALNTSLAHGHMLGCYIRFPIYYLGPKYQSCSCLPHMYACTPCWSTLGELRAIFSQWDKAQYSNVTGFISVGEGTWQTLGQLILEWACSTEQGVQGSVVARDRETLPTGWDLSVGWRSLLQLTLRKESGCLYCLVTC